MSNKFRIKPAGRHINSIGSDLIKDQYAALMELVKNSYDADAKNVSILFSCIRNQNGVPSGITIEVSDDGHGMDYKTVTGTWMTPSTSDKLKRKESPSGRPLQGRKGLGRYAVSMLGNELILDTTQNGINTITYINWEDFEKAEFLDDVEIEINTSKSSKKDGTDVIVQGNLDELHKWTSKEIRSLIFELKKLKSPDFEESISDDELEFNIELSFSQDWYLDDYQGSKEVINQFPIFENYHYRIWGVVDNEGKASLNFHNSRTSNTFEVFEKEIEISPNSEFPGKVVIDFRVYDRDSSSIQYLIDKGLKIPITGEKIGKRQARQLLSVYNGIGVYRNKFRIRPLGDPGFDWLELDKNRVQNPSRRIGSDQVIGYVHIQPEEQSGLEEKSARDGLKENRFYFGLKDICENIVGYLEQRRYIYRNSVGLSRSKKGLTDKVDGLFEFESLKTDVLNILDKLKINSESKEEVIQLIESETASKNKLASDIQKIIAIYQGQATVGKIVDILLHEGRRPLNFFKSESPRLRRKVNKISKSCKDDMNLKDMNYIQETTEIFEAETKNLANLFSRIDPLASRRTKKNNFKLMDCVKQAAAIFQSDLSSFNIEFVNKIDSSIQVFGWRADFSAAFVNLIDNSIYWLKRTKGKRLIEVISNSDYVDEIRISYRDTGPGIPEELIESQVIFEPDFSTKVEGGTGLGLAIAGESIQRNGGILRAEYPETEGALFVITLKSEENE